MDTKVSVHKRQTPGYDRSHQKQEQLKIQERTSEGFDDLEIKSQGWLHNRCPVYKTQAMNLIN